MNHSNERRKTLASRIFCLSAIPLLVAGLARAALLPQLERVSVTAGGQQSNGSSLSFADPPLDSRRLLSGDGRYVVFDSEATNLVPNDLNGNTDVFIRDRLADVTERVSVTSAGNEALGDSYSGEISEDGRWVVFTSTAANLAPGDLNGVSDVFLHDRQSGTTTRLSVAVGGGDGDGASFEPAISADGSTVAFTSRATNLVAGDANGVADVFVLDLASGVIERVSIADGGGDPNAASSSPALSGDGDRVAFVSLATNLVASPQRPFVGNVYLLERSTGTTTAISTRHDGSPAVGPSRHPTLSADGRWLAFASQDWLLVENAVDVDGAIEDVFLIDLQTGDRTLVTAGDDSRSHPRTSNPSLSDDGRFLAFVSRSLTIIPGKAFNGTDVYVYDRATGEVTRASRGLENSRGGTDGDSCSELPALSGDGHLVGFKSTSTNLVAGDTNGFGDVFVGLAGFECVTSGECTTDDGCRASPGVCNQGDRTCVFQGRPDGTACNDGNSCTFDEACEAGACVPQSQISCQPAGPCGLAGICNPATGQCSNPQTAPNGTPCSDPDLQCSAGGSCFFGQCRQGPGSEDPDGDGICSLDDNCPGTVNPSQSDVDLDSEGDVCDPADGEIRIARARLHWSRTATSENGTAAVWGELRNPLGAGAFPSDKPLRIHLRDGLDLDFAFMFQPSDCSRSRSGTILCRSDALRGVNLTLRPDGTAGGIESFRVKVRAAGLDLPGPFQPPVALSIVREPPVDVLGIDCHGDILSCRSTPRGMQCAAR